MNQPKDEQPGQGPQAAGPAPEAGADPYGAGWQIPPHHAQGTNYTGAPPWGWAYGQFPPEQMPPGYAPHAGYYAHPGQGWYAPPPGYAPPPQPQMPPGAPGSDPAMAGFSAAMGDMAEKSGLGMFKDLLNFDDGEFWKGALVGAALVMLLTNEELRNSLIGGAAKTAEAFKAGLAGNDAADEPDNDNDIDEHGPEEESTQ